MLVYSNLASLITYNFISFEPPIMHIYEPYVSGTPLEKEVKSNFITEKIFVEAFKMTS